MLKIAIIGAGDWSAYVHGPALAHYAAEHAGEIELVAVGVRANVPRGEEFAQKFGFARVYNDLDKLLDTEQPDACWVIAPIEGTRGLAGHIMERGVPVLFEKPPGKSLQEAQELAEISRRTGTPNQVGFNRRYASGTLQLVEWAKEHGPLDYLYARMLRSKRMDEEFAYGTGIHLLDCVTYLAECALGGVKESQVTRVTAPSGAYHFYVDLIFGSGARGRCDILPTCGVVDETYTLFGHNRSLVHSLPWTAGEVKVDGRAELWVEGKLAESHSYPVLPAHLHAGFYGEASAFLAALQEGRRPVPASEEVLVSVALAEATQRGEGLSF
jgi:predicted dehydrogenase